MIALITTLAFVSSMPNNHITAHGYHSCVPEGHPHKTAIETASTMIKSIANQLAFRCRAALAIKIDTEILGAPLEVWLTSPPLDGDDEFGPSIPISLVKSPYFIAPSDLSKIRRQIIRLSSYFCRDVETTRK